MTEEEILNEIIILQQKYIILENEINQINKRISKYQQQIINKDIK